MAEENKNQKSALEQLKELQKNDNISSLEFNEPDLKGFDAASVFEIKTHVQEEPKRKIFGKRAQRHAQVEVKASAFENDDVQIEDIYVSQNTKPQPMKRTEKTPVVEEVAVEQSPEIKEEEVQTESLPVEETIDTISVENLVEEIQKEVSAQEPVEELPEEVAIQESVEETQETSENLPEEMQDDSEPIIEKAEESETETKQIEEQPDLVETEDDDEIEPSLEDQENYDEEDLYVDKKHFLLSQYDKEEAYLEENSKEGYHYVRNVGKKYFFVKEEPRNYYYSISYFVVEPSAHEWRKWEQDGWKLVSRVPSKKKQEAGWFVFRNELKNDELRKEIPNEEEKFKFFKKYSNSCRSTMFLFFICMAICACAAYLQYLFNGFIAVMISCSILFVISFIFFCMYGRMLASSKKKVRLLKARLRVREREENFKNEGLIDPDQSVEDLDSQWDSLEDEEDEDEDFDDYEEDEDDYEEDEEEFELEEEEEPKKGFFRRRKNK